MATASPTAEAVSSLPEELPEDCPTADYFAFDAESNSRLKDFAESVGLYATDPARLKAAAPGRFKVIDRMLKDPSYGG